MSEDANDMLEVDGEQVSLADIAGVVMDDVAEVRGFTFPKGLFTWEIKEAALSIRAAKGVDTAVCSFRLECIDITSLIDDSLNPEDFIGKNYTETFWMKDLADEFGRIKAFLTDSGFSGSGTLQDLLEQCVGTEFMSKISHAVDKNDKSIVYANLDRRSITSVDGETTEEAAPEA